MIFCRWYPYQLTLIIVSENKVHSTQGKSFILSNQALFSFHSYEYSIFLYLSGLGVEHLISLEGGEGGLVGGGGPSNGLSGGGGRVFNVFFFLTIKVFASFQVCVSTFIFCGSGSSCFSYCGSGSSCCLNVDPDPA